jgi:hypothetical protein
MNVERDGIFGRKIWLRSSAEIGRTGGCGRLSQINGMLAMRLEALSDDGDFAGFLELRSTMLA